MGVQIIYEGVQLELYKDEGVNIVKKALDYENIGTSWSDFSQSFTIPATKVNNKAFKHYYNPDVIGGYNPFAANDASIYIDSQPRYKGVIRIIDIKYKNNLPFSYTIQFFSDNINLKEALKDITIADINWSSYNHTITVDKVRDYLAGEAITGDYTEDLHYPFFSTRSLLKWDNPNNLIYKEGVSFAASGAGGIFFDEFRPAAPISLIIRELFNLSGYEIDNKLEVDDTYSKAHIWLNNSETLSGTDLAVQQSMATLPSAFNVSKFSPSFMYQLPFINEVTNTGGYLENGGLRIPKTETYVITYTSYPYGGSLSNSYSYNVFVNGVLDSTRVMAGAYGEVDSFTLALTANDYVEFAVVVSFTDVINLKQDTSILIQSQSAFKSDFVVGKYVPKIDATKFIQGVLDLFNALIYYDVSTGKFVIQNRADWLLEGREIDLSKYISNKSKKMRPPTFFNTLEFKMKEGKDISGELFMGVYGKSYGTTTYTVGNVYGDTFTRDVPFTIPYIKLIDSDKEDSSSPQYTKSLTTTTSVDKSYKPINPGAFIMIKESALRDAGSNWKVKDYVGGTATSSLSNDFKNNTSSEKTLTFSTIKSANGQYIYTDTLFLNYYSDYINSLYGQGIRRMAFEAKIPLTIASDIQPNDIIIINLVKYLVEDIRINTLDNSCKLNLITR